MDTHVAPTSPQQHSETSLSGNANSKRKRQAVPDSTSANKRRSPPAGPAATSPLLLDAQGLAVSTSSVSALQHINEFVEQVLRYGQRWDLIAAAAKDAPRCVLAWLFTCDAHLARLEFSAAKEALSRATTLQTTDGTNARESLYVNAYTHWLDGQLKCSFDAFHKIVLSFPQDLFALKRAQLMAFLLGDAASMLEVAQQVQAVCAEKPYFAGMLAFALEQNGHLTDALEWGQYGCAQVRDDVWSQHAVAHSLFFMKKWQQGVEWLTTHSSSWRSSMSFMFTHNHFHLALFHLCLGNFKQVLQSFDTHISPSSADSKSTTVSSSGSSDVGRLVPFACNEADYFQDQLAALGILWKLQLHAAGNGELLQQVDSRWGRVLAHVEVPPAMHVDPLFDLHVLHALLRSGQTAQAKDMYASMVKHVQASPDAKAKEGRQHWLNVGAALLAAARKDFTGALGHVKAVVGSNGQHVGDPALLSVLGGSLEQREVVHEALVDILRRAGHQQWATAYATHVPIVSPIKWAQ